MFKRIINNSTKNTKKNFDIISIKRNKSTPNLFSEKEPHKTSGYYQKLYSLNPFQESNNSSIINNKPTPKKISLKSVFKQPDFPKPEFQFRKITNPKWPFSPKKTESKESIKERLKLSKPSKLFHNFVNIQWLRRKFPESVINKSIYTLLPNNGKPVVPEDESEEDKRHRLMLEYLESLKGPIGRDKYIEINPKYFFNKQTWETVLKLKQIFLDFDEDGNRRMELDEMQEMFESNKIFASINDLVDLFFKGKKFKEKDIMKLYLNFHQFINFALTKDQEFREFMRNIKEKAENEKIKKTKRPSNESQSDVISENEEEEKDDVNEEKGKYFPMNFKSLLDYFVDRGKQRESREIINKAIKEMNEIINTNIKKRKTERKPTYVKERKSSVSSEKILNKQKSFKINEEESNVSESNNKVEINRRKTLFTQKTIIPGQLKSILKEIKNINRSNQVVNQDTDDLKLNLEEDEGLKIDYEKQLQEVDFNKLINEFSKLFSVTQVQKKKLNKKINILPSARSLNKKEIEKNEKKVETLNIKENNIKKFASNTLFNSISTITKENTTFNKMNTQKLPKSNTTYNIKQSNKNKILTMNDFKNIDKNINLPTSHPYFTRNFKQSNNNNNYKKIIFNNSKSSFNKTNLPRFLEEINDNNKESYKINDYMHKAKYNLPRLKSQTTKYKSNSINYSLSQSKKSNKFIFPSTKEEINDLKKRKIKLKLHGGKINLFKKNININIPKSSTKYDYVPLGLLINKEKK